MSKIAQEQTRITGGGGLTGSFVTTSSFNAFSQSYATDSASFDLRIDSITGSGPGGIDDVLAISQALTNDRDIDLGIYQLNINSIQDGAVLNNRLQLSSGNYSQFANFGSVFFIKSAVVGNSQYAVVALDPTEIAFGQTEGLYQFQFMNQSSDFVKYLPVGISSSGEIVQMTSWPAGGSGSGTVDTGSFVTTASFNAYTGSLPVILIGSSSLDFPPVSPGAYFDMTMSIPGAILGDPVALGIPSQSILPDSSYYAWVTGSGVVAIRFSNINLLGSQNPVSGTFKVSVTKI